MIKVLIVDDSKFMRVSLERVLSTDPEIQIAGTARNGIEALDFLKTNPVDVVILDFFMPKMDGIETLQQIMMTNPIPTLMITIANKTENGDLFLKALRLGAFDIISKPSGLNSMYIDDLEEMVKSKIKLAFQSKQKLKTLANQINFQLEFEKKNEKLRTEVEDMQRSKAMRTQAILNESQTYRNLSAPFNVLCIGASTGGPSQIFDLVKNLRYSPALSIIVIQHMPGGFTDHFANRLSSIGEYKFVEASDGEKLRPGLGYVAPGNFHMYVTMKGNDIILQTDQSEKVWGLRPCIDYTMISAAQIFKGRCIGTILTGMGQDGTEGIKAIKSNGGITFAQSLEEALIDSMPEHAIKTGMVDFVMNVAQISNYLNQKIICN
jgi:two-component system chemotaxis response regulator CheB